MNYIGEMVELQRHLNNSTNGSNWVDGTTKDGRMINWNRCIYVEAIEALDSFNWKHWKDINTSDDWDNLLVELVDIWHFLMSEALTLGHPIILPKLNVNKNRAQLIIQLEIIAKLALDSSLVSKNRSGNIEEMLKSFFSAIACANLPIADLYCRYVVKNQLNILRQDYGYKYGNYQKIWHGKEDNVVAFKLMTDNNFTPSELYQELKKVYVNL